MLKMKKISQGQQNKIDSKVLIYVPFLYLGTLNAAGPSTLVANGITHILSIRLTSSIACVTVRGSEAIDSAAS
ncbi:hypothetical protein EW146_g8525 [Bondarzewia mesenterica]|uniref:Uncharacterized protein n=1 Tax=Bondarzewia mesenterica TaxID=1095465 RepID=A0A4S4LFL1_9AGAM|nr:hypothetical protein EW146_g8525 [Bondarzewia mesenterica]